MENFTAPAVLVVVDCQNDFINEDAPLGNKETAKVPEKIAELLKKYPKEYSAIYVTMDTHDEETYMRSQEGKKLPVPHCYEGTDGFRLHRVVDDAICKYGVSASFLYKKSFGTLEWNQMHFTELAFAQRIDIVGVCTDICVVSNALILKTVFPETDIRVYSDCCAGITPESHEAALAVMKSCQIEVIELKDKKETEEEIEVY